MRKLSLSLLSVAVVSTFSAMAEDTLSTIERLTIIGSSQAVNDIPGSAAYISQQELDVFSYTDISRVLGSTPGVYVQEEDGYGLRPNIGMRGTGTSRNDKITVMEDGVLIAPAPYVAPAAYYFPTTGRLEAVEIIKGSSSVKYGPRTTGGVLNLVSRSIPQAELAGRIDATMTAISTALPHIQAGKLRVLGVANEERTPLYPQAPTLRESGLPSVVGYGWYGLMVPLATPAAVVQRLNRETNAVLADAEMRKKVEAAGLQVRGGTPGDFAAFIDSEMRKWAQVIQAADIKPE